MLVRIDRRARLRAGPPPAPGRWATAEARRRRSPVFTAGVVAAVWGFILSAGTWGADSAPAATNAKTADGDRASSESAFDALAKEEVDLADQVVKDFPGNPDAIAFVGLVYRLHGKAIKAQQFWDQCLKLSPSRPGVLVQMGWVAMVKGEYAEAANHWRKVLDSDPKTPGVHSGLGRALMGLGNPAEARAVLEKGVGLFPTDVMARFLLGQVCLQLQDYEKAREHYAAAIQMQPNLTNAYYGLAMVCTRLGEKEKAAECRRKFAELKKEDLKVLKDENRTFSDYLDVCQRVAQNYTAAGRLYATAGQARKAETLWVRAAALDSRSVQCRGSLAMLYQSTNRPQQALEMYAQLEQIQPDNPAVSVNLGFLYVRQGQFDAAEKAFRKAMELAPESPASYRELARLFLAAKHNLQEAKKLAEKAVQLEPAASNYALLSMVCHKTGDAAGAVSAIRRAIELDPNNPQYRQLLGAIQKGR